MRPIYFFILMGLPVPATLIAQSPVALAMRTAHWPIAATATATATATPADNGIGWSVFSKQYYCVSNWNATGLSVDYQSGPGQTALLLCRDGIQGFSWYHLNLSHYRQFKKFSAMLQLRFSLIDLKDRPMVFRLGGNISTGWDINQTLMLRVNLYDFTGWMLPGAAMTKGDPAMQFMLFQEPGRLIGLAGGFRISPFAFGPVTGGIRVYPDDRIALMGLFEVLPFGVSLGISWRINGLIFKGWLGHNNGLGVTPMVELGIR